MKKALALILALVMCLSLCACGNSSQVVPAELIFCMKHWASELGNDATTVIMYEGGALVKVDGGKIEYTWKEIVPLESENGITAAEVQLYQSGKKAIVVKFYQDPNGLDTAVLGDTTLYWVEDLAKQNLPTEGAVLETTISETTIPETTAAPEPVYETIEITMDNWQEYFEFKLSEGWWMEDAFGDAERYMGAIFFAVKEEYLDVINPKAIDIALSCSYVQEFRYCEVDFENRTFVIGEIVPNELLGGHISMVGEGETRAKEMTNTTEYGVWNFDCFKEGNVFNDTNGASMINWPDPLDISRIQGTIEIQTN